MTATTSKSGVVCAGNWIVDTVHGIDQWPQKNDLVRIDSQTVGVGGGAANVLSDLRSLGAEFPLVPVGKLGRDQYAEIILKHCREFGFPLDFLVQDDTAPTAHTHVMNLPGDSRTFFYQGGTNDTFDADDVPMERLAELDARVFYLGYLTLLGRLDIVRSDGTTQAGEVLEKAQDSGMKTCVDLVSTKTAQFEAIVCAALPYIDYLIVNETEIARTCGSPVFGEDGTLDSDLLLTAAQYALDNGVSTAVIVHCPQTALWLAKDSLPIWSEPEPVEPHEIKSPVGAGDAFCAGVIFGIHEGWSAEQTLKLAHKAARAALGGLTATDGVKPICELLPKFSRSNHGAGDGRR